jgi:hypothetical protein
MGTRPRKKVDSKAVFEHANFHRISKETLVFTLSRTKPIRPQIGLALSSVVLSAFSSEVYLKCLYSLENAGFLPEKDIHDLDKLFELLCDETQKGIETEWDEWASRDPIKKRMIAEFGSKVKTDLRSCLAEGAKAFAQYRYAYEGGVIKGFSLALLPEVLYNVIVSNKTDWGNKLSFPPATPVIHHIRPIIPGR